MFLEYVIVLVTFQSKFTQNMGFFGHFDHLKTNEGQLMPDKFFIWSVNCTKWPIWVNH